MKRLCSAITRRNSRSRSARRLAGSPRRNAEYISITASGLRRSCAATPTNSFFWRLSVSSSSIFSRSCSSLRSSDSTMELKAREKSPMKSTRWL